MGLRDMMRQRRTHSPSAFSEHVRGPEDDEDDEGEDERALDAHGSLFGSRRFTRTRRRASMTDIQEGDGANTQRWKDLKNTLRFINRSKKKRDEDGRRDHEKSAELIAELAAGAPAALILASAFQRDEKDKHRLPILLEQLKIRITDSSRTADRQHTMFRIELEYGSGFSRMKWVIHRDFRDFLNLHSRLRVLDLQRTIYANSGGAGPKRELPHFPRSAIPYLRGVRGLTSMEQSTVEQSASLAGPPSAVNVGRPQTVASSRHSIMSFLDDAPGFLGSYRAGNSSSAAQVGGPHTAARQSKYAERQRQSLEDYLKSLVSYMIFRGTANRLCKFLEFSAMGLRLSGEKSYHGKEGPLTIISSSHSQGWRTHKFKPNNIKAMFNRHSSKWFLVRHSYLVIVDSILDVTPTDVFLVDQDFKFSHKQLSDELGSLGTSVQNKTKLRFTLKLSNSERRIKLLARSEKHLRQWVDSLNYMASHSPWARPHRFGSFSPVRYNVHAQWFVDGRDYFWNVSQAIDLAKDIIFIHDWWLSPEIYLRRPAHGNQQWRLDRLLKRKAEQGVKIFVILYRNVGAAMPINSQYTKQSLLDLHPNIFVSRSPNQFRQNILFWAHHEKIVVVDHAIAFVGGLDLCYGRWDTPQHVLADDKPMGFEQTAAVDFGEQTQLWVGKDYSNARIQDFYELDRPYDDMYDRTAVPRMPWHDVHMQVLGQPARDLSRHFTQRWNYLIRQKRSSRPTPVLLPPPEFTESELEGLDLQGTCEIQILRSACAWSLGLANDKIERSIANAYLKAIEQSEHFVYIENQFFITSTSFDGTVIENEIGDALVERIMRAHRHNEDWRAVVVIPLMPGFESEVDEQDGTSVRLIMQCQFRTISRGPNSIFARLERADINPDDYISFYSLRKWGKIGPAGNLVTEQLYIHAKIMVVDDRVAIIGSANINERSMRGNRDSEVAAFVRDMDQFESRMGGQPYMVGRFPHTLRVRLMREHLGIDVDRLEEFERQNDVFEHNRADVWKSLQKLREANTQPATVTEPLYADDYPNADSRDSDEDYTDRSETYPAQDEHFKLHNETESHFDHAQHTADVDGYGPDRMHATEAARENMSRALERKKEAQKDELLAKASQVEKDRLAAGATGEGANGTARTAGTNGAGAGHGANGTGAGHGANGARAASGANGAGSTAGSTATPATLTDDSGMLAAVDPYQFQDPLDESFFYELWHAHAVNNTTIFRNVFRCQPDNQVQTWKDYKEYTLHGQKFARAQQEDAAPKPRPDDTQLSHDERPRAASNGNSTTVDDTQPSEASPSSTAVHPIRMLSRRQRKRSAHMDEPRRRRHRAHADTVMTKPEAQAVLDDVRGHLIVFPYDWLVKEDEAGNWFYNIDRIPPIEIYD
ncbi:uncharacterized protein V1510DRAFT_396593 [Dipodascopsis tothii]|uniref:uncharacterized protein n=1 Tax=Dipodascopsis tothii TaxID=44089 RepID=UPI0034CDC863